MSRIATNSCAKVGKRIHITFIQNMCILCMCIMCIVCIIHIKTKISYQRSPIQLPTKSYTATNEILNSYQRSPIALSQVVENKGKKRAHFRLYYIYYIYYLGQHPPYLNKGGCVLYYPCKEEMSL